MPPFLLDSGAVDDLLEPDALIAAAKTAFRLQGEGHAVGLTAAQATFERGGMFHLKAGGLAGDVQRYGVKLNARFPVTDMPSRVRVNGVVVVADAVEGTIRGLIDSSALTAARTAAATVVAVQALVMSPVRRVSVVGTGAVARAHLQLLAHALREAEFEVWGRSTEQLQAAIEFSGTERSRACPDLKETLKDAEVVVTCTPSQLPLIDVEDVPVARLIAATGADSPGKQELSSHLTAQSAIVTDVTEQCAEFGEYGNALRHFGEENLDLRGELGQIVAGRVRPPTTRTVFDSTGSAFLDVAVAHMLVERAALLGKGIELDW